MSSSSTILYSGFRWAVHDDAEFVEADVGDYALGEHTAAR